MYWSEADSKGLFYTHLDQPGDRTFHVDLEFSNLTSLITAVPKFDGENACAENNGGCEHICLSIGETPTCLCSAGFELGSDSKTCARIVHCPGFTCVSDRRCIHQRKHCDEKADCADNSDEVNCNTTCKNLQCQHSCRITSHGPQCNLCEPNDRNMAHCQDVDCTSPEFNPCSQKCTNVKNIFRPGQSEYECDCYTGYSQGRDYFSCMAEGPRPSVFVSFFGGIKRLFTDGNKDSVFATSIATPYSLDIDVKRQNVYWYDVMKLQGKPQFRLWKKNMETNVVMSVLSGLHFIDIAIDWMTGNIYFSHEVAPSSERHITVYDSIKYQTTIVSGKSYRPSQILLHPSQGFMFWVSEDKFPAQLMKSSMDGADIRRISQVLPHGKCRLALDSTMGLIFWYDLYSKKLVAADFDGVVK